MKLILSGECNANNTIKTLRYIFNFWLQYFFTSFLCQKTFPKCCSFLLRFFYYVGNIMLLKFQCNNFKKNIEMIRISGFRNVMIFLYVDQCKYIQVLMPCSNKSKAYTPTAMFPSFLHRVIFCAALTCQK